jgi:hypothetical protein
METLISISPLKFSITEKSRSLDFGAKFVRGKKEETLIRHADRPFSKIKKPLKTKFCDQIYKFLRI